MSAPEADSSYPTFSRQRRLDVFLTTVQHASAGLVGAFFFVHLTAPAVASLGGESSSSTVMILGRELYQSPIGEKSLLAAGSLHISSGILKRIIASKRRNWTLPSWKSLSWHSISGIALVPLVVAHAGTHRWYPAYMSLSPAFIDYGFVVRALQKQPVLSYLGYASILVAGAYHWFAGTRKIMSRGRKQAILHDKSYKIAFYSVVGSVGLGLASLAREHKVFPPALLAKWDSLL